MKTVWYLVNRNRKLFFKDKGMLFTALITPLILRLMSSANISRITMALSPLIYDIECPVIIIWC